MAFDLPGDEHELNLSQGQVRYRDLGEGQPVVFVHGLLVDGALWRGVTPSVADGARCLVPDLPLGSHRAPLRADADLSPPGLARLIADFIEGLSLGPVTLVANDTGGAIAQLVATRHPDVLERLVLTNCDAYENFLPPMFRPLQAAARVPGAVATLMQGMRFDRLRRLPNAYGRLTKRPLPKDLLDRWTEPARADAGIRRDLRKFLAGISNRYTLQAAQELARFDRPTLIAWAPEDRFFKVRHAEGLAATIPDARLERVEDSWAFVPEDQPEPLSALIRAFIG